MTFDEYWQRLQTKNPGLRDLDNKMHISVESFQNQLRAAFNEGESASSASNPFDKLFGGKKR